ncbi:LysR substrate-binding domain-containing protein [Pantoea sp. 18069]|uniref:LysR substrate-binding domain-containing protein n=1 Tax=Pantoea sp. 18069 TaxID=2681415 RepID=UPI00135838D1|nr:LysR substrate-binding domain-containing protein [Pantoea sp. 18069]
MDKLPPLHAIRAFEAAARLASISRAAAELHVTPGAISRQVRGLEALLGVSLFERGHRSIALTDAGRLYAAELTHLFGLLREATQNISTIRPPLTLRLGSPPTFAARWLIPRMQPFHAAEPEIEVQIRSVTDQPDWHSLDAAVLFGDGQWPGCSATPLVSNQIAPVCSPAYLAAQGPFDSIADIPGKTLLYSLTRPEDWSAWLAYSGVPAPLALQTRRLGYESSMLAYQACRHGLGLAMAQSDLIAQDLADGGLVIPFATKLDMGRRTYYLVMPRRTRQNRQLARLANWLVTAPQCGTCP